MKGFLLAIALLFATAPPASASLVSYEFAGAVTSVQDLGPYLPGINVGTAVTGLLTYDPSLGFQDPLILGFNSPVGVDVSVSDYDFQGRFPIGSPGFFLWSGFFSFTVDGPVSPAFITDLLQMQWNAANPGANPGLLTVFGVSTTDEFRSKGFVASIDQITPVPDGGSTALLLTLGIGALIRMRLF